MSKNSDVAATFKAEDKVTFHTAGRNGVSPKRHGVVVEAAPSERGVWLVIREDGAAEGVTVKTRASLVTKH